jgi:two-component system, cell cycle response regulator
MSARILVVDDVPANIKLLEARLTAEYFEVYTAGSGADALALCQQGNVDIILLDVMMPEMDGFEVCRRLKADRKTAHLPVVMVTALDQPADRVQGLDAGADDFLTKPVDEIALLARVRSLARLKVAMDELRIRASTSANFGMRDLVYDVLSEKEPSGRILIVEDREVPATRMSEALGALHDIEIETKPQDALFRAAEGNFDMIIVSLGLDNYDALRLCSQVRSLERTRSLPTIMIADTEDRARVMRGLDLGMNDYILRPIDRNELVARVRTQLRRKKYTDSLNTRLQTSIEMAVVDQLTGLHNRRFMDMHLATMMEQAAGRNKPLALLVLDIDHFKKVNDTYGHDAGDDVLRTFATRVKSIVRGADMFCRMGGEEFIIAMPDTSGQTAAKVAERIRATIAADIFPIQQGTRAIPVTVSIGLAERGNDLVCDAVIKRADKALYRAKAEGRNRVIEDAA